jgi:dynein heavy chain
MSLPSLDPSLTRCLTHSLTQCSIPFPCCVLLATDVMTRYLAKGPMASNITPMQAVQRLTRYREEFTIRDRKYKLYHGGEELFALPLTEYPELELTRNELKLLQKLYDLYVDVIDTSKTWREVRWLDFQSQVEKITEKVEKFSSQCRKMPTTLREWPAYNDLSKQIKDFQIVLPLLQELCKDCVKPRHWKEVMEVTGTELRIDSSEMKLSELLDARLENHNDAIEEICESAEKQQTIETKLREMNDAWSVAGFEFTSWKTKAVPILSGVVPIMEDLEDAQMNLQAMLTMRHVVPFRAEAQQLLASLSETSDTLERWVKVQMLWCSLESVFTGGDIAKQLPMEAKKFGKVDKDWVKIMAKAAETVLVVPCCANELLKNALPVMYSELEKCQKSLEGYLEQKRCLFPRFYFVSNPVLLQILSQGSNPIAIQPFYEKIFDCISMVEHEDAQANKMDILVILSLSGSDSERVRLRKPVAPKGNIENWLDDLRVEQQHTMKAELRRCADSFSTIDTGNSSSMKSSLLSNVNGSCGQFALLGIQFIWTTDMQTALEECRTNKGAMPSAKERALNVLNELSSWCLTDLKTKINRMKIETLVTIQVHQRDVTDELVVLWRQRKLSSAESFDWLKQARFYFRPDENDHMNTAGQCAICVADVEFEYQHEYLGVKERLVITPLTDRCYITLSQAMGMFFGGSPAGPAGTGKTETVKDLGRTLGIYVVVTNCTDQMRYHHCAKIFKGLCAAGLWGCFDEFNRITLPVLSVVAQQVQAILNAKKGWPKVKDFTFPGEASKDSPRIILKPICGVFITMNPGYAGRQELPENLKALFRGVTMMVPDREIIIKVKLCSVGYSQFPILSRKFQTLYKLCEEQLSNQRHYDFGLRNVLSVLRTAGATKRLNLAEGPVLPEAVLLYRTLRDMNLSKLVSQDVPLFLSLLKDLFPEFPAPANSSYPEVENAVKDVCVAQGLRLHETWLLKVTQLYETTRVRHGIMLSGAAGGGKSTIIRTLQTALGKVTGITYKISCINPKAMLAAEMYGQVDPMSGEWTTGVFAAMWAKFNQRTNKFHTWILADGPVDAIWIEDLNSVLDDNRILTLANGDRIPMTDNVLIIFENENLNNASPATVSRAGIIYVSSTDLGWFPPVQTWARRFDNKALHDVLENLFVKYVGVNTQFEPGHLFDFLSRNTTPVMSSEQVGLTASCCDLLGSLIRSLPEGGNGPVDPDAIERLFLYALVWSVGGLLSETDRPKLDEFLRGMSSTDGALPDKREDGDTIYEYFLDANQQWEKWVPPEWTYPETDTLDFSNLLVPTMDSTRATYILRHMHKSRVPALMVGGIGTAKTSTAIMFLNELDSATMLVKQINFSSATVCSGVQSSIEAELDKRGGKNFGPPGGKRMMVFFDDLSMPRVNEWNDQPTLEIVRQIIEEGGFCFLEKDKRGDFKTCEDLEFLACMQMPGGGRNDIPSRLKRHFFMFNVILPAVTSINDIFGQMLEGRFADDTLPAEALEVVGKLTTATIDLWNQLRARMLPTPAKFHYVFNLRDLSRVFQGILLTPLEVVRTGGVKMPDRPEHTLVRLWFHECERVMCDKLTNNTDKDKFHQMASKTAQSVFGEYLAGQIQKQVMFVNFFRDLPEPTGDENDDDLDERRPRVYEASPKLAATRERVQEFMDDPEAGYNARNPASRMDLILFDDALRHLVSISRVICMPRGSCLLVGVGGSGKQSLTRLAAFIAEQTTFQIALTKAYNQQALKDDLRKLFVIAGQQRKELTFLFTDAEIKEEAFLEYINSILLTGEVAGLFSKEEYLAMCADLVPSFQKDRPGQIESPVTLKAYFRDQVRDNLHVVLCMSPMNPLFPIRARKFPGVISCCTIDWFLPWPEEALIDVSRGFIDVPDFHVECPAAVKEELINHMGYVHAAVTERCHEFYGLTKRHVYQTPKSYLFFIKEYKASYSAKLAEVMDKEQRTTLGLSKLIQGAQDVAAMKTLLVEEEKKLNKATIETNAMLASLRESSAAATLEGDKVSKIKASCVADADRIAKEKAQCEHDLAKAQPFVDKALAAIDSIEPKHIAEIKKLAKPASIIRLVFDCVLILFKRNIEPVKPDTILVNKQDVPFLSPSSDQAQLLMSDTSFLKNLFHFGTVEKDLINEETIELLEPYMELCCPDGSVCLDPAIAKKASVAAEGLCTWAIAMTEYHGAAKIIKPKLEALARAEGNLALANRKLQEATARFNECAATLKRLQDQFEAQMATKRAIEEGLETTKNKMTKAENLISGLAGERVRWSEDKERFADVKAKLVGDCAVACAFISYCGAFNQQYRGNLIGQTFTADLLRRKVPTTPSLNVISFLVDEGTIGDWQLEGLPSDPLSIQNGILVTRSARFPLMIDPQNQAVSWLLARERANLPINGDVTDMDDKRLKDQLEFALGEGKTLIIAVEEDVDPLLDPVLEKRIQKKGKSTFIVVADKKMDYTSTFNLLLVSRLPNPQFSPELQAKTTLIDFTVTQKGLEEQLLAKVIQREQKALEEQLNIVVEQVTQNTKTLLRLDADLLQRLTSSDGNLLDDDELVGVLKSVKDTAEDVKKKLVLATDTKTAIQTKREQYRPVATRGAVLYFSIVDMSNVNVMYQTSLKQFQVIFQQSFDDAETSNVLQQRVDNIIETLTYIVYRYINRGLYEKDRQLFVFVITTKILITASLIGQSDMDLFLRGGAALDINAVAAKPFAWMSDAAWLNVLVLTQQVPSFKTLTNDIRTSEAVWKKWYDDNTPETLPIPGYEQQIKENRDTGAFLRLLLVRALRMDRTLVCISDFVLYTPQMGPRYVEPVTDSVESVYEGMDNFTPVVFLLSMGADPTEAIEQLAKKKKTSVECISMGEGQDVAAMKAMQNAWAAGTWVLLQNCELGLDLMVRMEKIIQSQVAHENYRLMITAAPDPSFPLGLLQMSTKAANEPPLGLRAGLLRSFITMIDQDKLERIESPNWRKLLHTLCFLHSVVQERRKFGPLGWNIPYEFNTGDLSASITFIEKHLFDNEISWDTVQYMVSEVQYGGKITEDMDMRLFKTYAAQWLTSGVMRDDFTFNPPSLIQAMPDNFVYKLLDSTDVNVYREYCGRFPRIDSPEIIGLHPNADMSFRVKDVTEMLDTLSATKPKGGGGGGGSGGVSRDTVVYDKAGELLEKMPPDFVEEVYMQQIKSMGGLDVPLNIFLYQEIQRMQAVLASVRSTLISLQLAIKGEVVLTEALVTISNDIFDARVPKAWIYTMSGTEFSWILPTLGLWFSSLTRRQTQYSSWLERGRPVTFWMTGFFNPQGFLTGMKQEVTRQHRGENWALDDVMYSADVTQHASADRVGSAPKEGVYVEGLFLEGARWDMESRGIAESLPKVLFDNMPVLYVSATITPKKAWKDAYQCPCYKYRIRQGRFLIFHVPLPAGGRNASHWILRGVAMLCSTA